MNNTIQQLVIKEESIKPTTITTLIKTTMSQPTTI